MSISQLGMLRCPPAKIDFCMRSLKRPQGSDLCMWGQLWSAYNLEGFSLGKIDFVVVPPPATAVSDESGDGGSSGQGRQSQARARVVTVACNHANPVDGGNRSVGSSTSSPSHADPAASPMTMTVAAAATIVDPGAMTTIVDPGVASAIHSRVLIFDFWFLIFFFFAVGWLKCPYVNALPVYKILILSQTPGCRWTTHPLQNLFWPYE